MLLRLGRFVVLRRRAVMALTALLVVFGAWGMMNGTINYDLLSYLPEDLDSVRGFDVISDEFALGTTLQVLVRGESDAAVGRLVTEIRAIDGVKGVSWAADLGPVEVPREFRDQAVSETYYADDGTLLRVSFDGAPTEPRVVSAIDDIKALLAGHDAALTGAQQAELQEVMEDDRVRFAALALLLVTVALLLTVPSVIVPVLFVVTIGAAVVVNLGLSYYLGQEVSYLTGVVVFALQFAVTMDYALFLYHRFEEERRRATDAEAMAVAVAATFKSVLSAAATTIAGFLALSAMHLRLGADLGLTLARGVLVTMLAVLFLLPGLMLDAMPVINRFRHKVPRFDFSRLGRFIARHAGVFTLVAVALFVPALVGNARLTLTYNLNASLPEDLPSVVGAEEIGRAFGREETVFVALEETGSMVDLERLAGALRRVDGVSRVFGYTSLVDPRIPEEFVPAAAREAFFSGGYTYLTLDVAYGLDDARLPATLDAVRSVAAREWPGRSYVTGQAVLVNDMERISQGDAERINLLSVAAIFVIVGIAFSSLSVPVALIGVIQLAILLNLGLESLKGSDLIFVASLAIGAIQLGATVDYAILITTRYEEELKRSKDRVEAVTVALAESSQSILVSAATMFSATIALAVMSRVGIVSSLTMLIARGALISFAVVVLFLPAVLVTGQPLFERLSVGWPRHTTRGE